MIIIADDTFVDRHKFHDVSYLNEDAYLKVCTVFFKIKTIDIEELENQLLLCKLFCNHKTLQLYDIKGNALDNVNNTKQRDNILNKVSQTNIPRIEFSRGLETNFEAKKIDKDLFYANLKALLDYFINNKVIEIKILFWGEEFQERERLSIIQNMMKQIRMTDIENFKINPAIKDGLLILYPKQSTEYIVDNWINKQLSKNEIIKEINNQLK